MFSKLVSNEGRWVGGVVLAIFLFALVNVAVSTLSSYRVDLTQDQLFTLSDGTKKIIRDIQEPITLGYYFSSRLGKEIPTHGNYAARVGDMLNEFKSVAGDKIRIEKYDPVAFSEVEDNAVSDGLQGAPIDQSGEKVYFGIVGKAGEAKETIPFLQPNRERFLEYDLARMVFALQLPKKPVVGVITSRLVFGDPRAQFQGQEGKTWILINQIRPLFEIRQITSDFTSIDDDIDILLLIHPPTFQDSSLYAIDQFVLRGGRLLAFLDPYNESAALGAGGFPSPPSSNLNPLLGTWGIEMDDGKLVGDIGVARLVNAGRGEDEVVAVPFITWLELTAANASRIDAVTSNIRVVNMASSGALRTKEGAKTTITPLLFTTNQTQIIESEAVKGQIPDIMGLLENFKPSGETYTLAARISGDAVTAFPDGAPKPESEPEEDKAAATKPAESSTDSTAAEESTGQSKPLDKVVTTGGTAVASETTATEEAPKPEAKPHIANSIKPINVIVFADSDMLEDRFWATEQEFFGERIVFPHANNGDLVVNALDNLSGSNDLIGLRSRGTSYRPFSLIADLQTAAEQRFRAEEQRLQKKVAETQEKLQSLSTGKQPEAAGAELILSEEQQAEIATFRQELVESRGELREVQLALRQDIETLQGALRFANIALIPILVTLFAAGLGGVRAWRRRRRRIR
jgi:ABC-type uncharacterized transport system involved in gliding motility auxiliary subunit